MAAVVLSARHPRENIYRTCFALTVIKSSAGSVPVHHDCLRVDRLSVRNIPLEIQREIIVDGEEGSRQKAREV